MYREGERERERERGLTGLPYIRVRERKTNAVVDNYTGWKLRSDEAWSEGPDQRGGKQESKKEEGGGGLSSWAVVWSLRLNTMLLLLLLLRETRVCSSPPPPPPPSTHKQAHRHNRFAHNLRWVILAPTHIITTLLPNSASLVHTHSLKTTLYISSSCASEHELQTLEPFSTDNLWSTWNKKVCFSILLYVCMCVCVYAWRRWILAHGCR